MAESAWGLPDLLSAWRRNAQLLTEVKSKLGTSFWALHLPDYMRMDLVWLIVFLSPTKNCLRPPEFMCEAFFRFSKDSLFMGSRILRAEVCMTTFRGFSRMG